MNRGRIVALTLSMLAVGGIVFLGLSIFKLRRLIVISPFADTGIRNAFDKPYTFLIKTDQIKNSILQNPIWQDVQVHIVNPSTVEVSLTAKKPVAAVEFQKTYIPVASDGTPLPKSEGGELPTIAVSSLTDYKAGNTDWRVTKAVDIIESLNNAGISVSKVTIEQKNSLFIIAISEGTQIVVPQTFSPSELAASLQIIIGRFRIEGKSVTKIDFQYDKPVIILSSQTKGIMQ